MNLFMILYILKECINQKIILIQKLLDFYLKIFYSYQMRNLTMLAYKSEEEIISDVLDYSIYRRQNGIIKCIRNISQGEKRL